MQEVVSVELAEQPRKFQSARFRKMHTPVDVFVRCVVQTDGDCSRDRDSPRSDTPPHEVKRNTRKKNQKRSVPPFHRDGPFILLAQQVVRPVGFKGRVVYPRMRSDGIFQPPRLSVHKVFVKRPFKKGGIDDTRHSRDTDNDKHMFGSVSVCGFYSQKALT